MLKKCPKEASDNGWVEPSGIKLFPKAVKLSNKPPPVSVDTFMKSRLFMFGIVVVLEFEVLELSSLLNYCFIPNSAARLIAFCIRV